MGDAELKELTALVATTLLDKVTGLTETNAALQEKIASSRH